MERDEEAGAAARKAHLSHRHRRRHQLSRLRPAPRRRTAERRRSGEARHYAGGQEAGSGPGRHRLRPVDKPEGLALIDENTLAVINDNDFGVGRRFDPGDRAASRRIRTRRQSCSASCGWRRMDWMPAIRMAASTSQLAGAEHVHARRHRRVHGRRARPIWSRPTRATPAITVVTARKRGWATWRSTPRSSQMPPNFSARRTLGRLFVSTASTDTDGDGLVDRIAAFGGRSFSIWDAAGNLVFDSGDAIERITAEAAARRLQQQWRERLLRQPQRRQRSRTGGAGAGRDRRAHLCLCRAGAHRRRDGLGYHRPARAESSCNTPTTVTSPLPRGSRRPGARRHRLRAASGQPDRRSAAPRRQRVQRHDHHVGDHPTRVETRCFVTTQAHWKNQVFDWVKTVLSKKNLVSD
jgi:hypothetical protein